MAHPLLNRQQDQTLGMLIEAGSRGVHSFDMRHAGIGNPSQRVTELVDLFGVVVEKRREKLRLTIGVRWTLVSAPSSLTNPQAPVPAPTSPPPVSPAVSSPAPPPGGGDVGPGEQLALEVPRAA